MPRLSLPVAIGLALIPMALIYVFAVPKFFGAHPWWAQKVVLIGTPIGLVFATMFRVTMASYILRVVITLVITIGLYMVASSAGEQFAASYAEDTIAGSFWYLGWIATSASLSALILSVLSR